VRGSKKESVRRWRDDWRRGRGRERGRRKRKGNELAMAISKSSPPTWIRRSRRAYISVGGREQERKGGGGVRVESDLSDARENEETREREKVKGDVNEPASVQIPRTEWKKRERDRKKQVSSRCEEKRDGRRERVKSKRKLTLSTRAVPHFLSERSEVDSSLEGHLQQER